MKNFKEKMVGKWKYVIVLFIIVVYFLVAIFISRMSEPKAEDYLIVGDTLVMQKYDNTWRKLGSVSNDVLEKEYTVIDGSNKISGAKVQYVNNEWYFFDADYRDLNPQNFALAYSHGDYNALSFVPQYYADSDYNIVNNVLVNNGFSMDDNFRVNTRHVDVDLDGDDQTEKIYTTTNVSLSGYSEEYFSVMFLVKNNTVMQTIATSTNDPFMVYGVVDLDGDNVYELIVSHGDIDRPNFDSCYQIYKKYDDRWALEQDCLVNYNG